MSQKIKITKPGFDVLTETDPKNLTFDSELNHLKTRLTGNFQYTLPSFATTNNGWVQTLNHGLGYTPLILCYYRDVTFDPNNWFIAMGMPEATNTRQLTPLNVSVMVTSSQAKFSLNNNNTNGRVAEVYYELFYEGV